MKGFAGLALAVAAGLPAFAQAQTPAAVPEFEVASIKPAAPPENGMIRVSMGSDPGRVNYTNVSLKNVLMRAYNVRSHQIAGPSWLDSERFDINAKIPDGAPKEQVPAMLQNLLAERFKMVVHRETKDQQVYALVVGKDGPKLKKSEDGPDEAPPGGAGQGGGARMAVGAPGAPPPPPPPGGGHAGPAQVPRGAMMIMNNGTTSRLEARRATVASFCDMLSNMLDRPVVDKTGLEGNYDIALEVAADELMGLRRMAVGSGGPPIGHAPPEGAAMPAPETSPGASIFSAVQQLGLKLEGTKAPIEYIVVDKAEKVPTEN